MPFLGLGCGMTGVAEVWAAGASFVLLAQGLSQIPGFRLGDQIGGLMS